jgi:glucosamine--fructose-6-phosphate aminotransferase (isomerizing)
MCGVIGYVGRHTTPDLFYNGLKRLEYRGYDSAGIAVLDNTHPVIIRAEGKLSELKNKMQLLPNTTHIGIGHTRWATHGKPSVENAHPHQSGEFCLLHNGIIENYLPLKQFLIKNGYQFSSETDTEIAVHLLHYEYHKIKRMGQNVPSTAIDYEQYVKQALISCVAQIRGTFAFVILCTDTPETVYAAKFASPLVIGRGESGNYIASGVAALVDHTKEIVVLEDRDMAILRKNGVEIFDFEGVVQNRGSKRVEWTADLMEKNGFDHFMLKEIHESPKAVSQTIMNRLNLNTGRVDLKAYGIANLDLKKFDRIQIVACGSSYYAGLLGKSYIESFTHIPVDVDIASEYRYRICTATPNTLTVAISQSGETIDTLHAVKHARANHSTALAIVNAPQSTIAHYCQAESLIYAGPEIGVASTKVFSAQIASLIILGLAFAQEKAVLPQDEILKIVQSLFAAPTLMDSVLELSERVSHVGKKFIDAQSMLFIGRGLHWPVAMEGALKLKEISYIHAQGYPSGELKHGPIALIDSNMTVVCVCPQDELYEKNISNIQEIKARSGKILAIGTDGDEQLKNLSDDFIGVPHAASVSQPLLTTVVVHLLAYWIAVHRGQNIDQPRNLAKSVTVE